MTATLHPRPPLGLPPGSIRGLLSLQIAIIFWLLLIIPSDPDRKIPIPLNLYFLASLVMMFFVSHGKSIASRRDPAPSPLWLPGGTFRFILLAGTIAVFADLTFRHPERFARLTPDPEQMTYWLHFLIALGGGFILGYSTKILPFLRHSWIFQAFQAWMAIIAMAILLIEMIYRVFVGTSLTENVEPVIWSTAVTGIVAFYFGSRS
jgi:hypothetical protein